VQKGRPAAVYCLRGARLLPRSDLVLHRRVDEAASALGDGEKAIPVIPRNQTDEP